MNKLLVIALLSISSLVEAKGASFSGGRSSFGGASRGFSSSRSYSSPSLPPPKPVINKTINNHTTVVQQTVMHSSPATSGGGMGFMGTLLATGAGSYIGNKLAQPDVPTAPTQPAGVQQQYAMCPAVIPVGWNTPCIPAANQGAR